ncbi:hypothetical protein KCU61_g411, partial [Aureobasidium melanogenum]
MGRCVGTSECANQETGCVSEHQLWLDRSTGSRDVIRYSVVQSWLPHKGSGKGETRPVKDAFAKSQPTVSQVRRGVLKIVCVPVGKQMQLKHRLESLQDYRQHCQRQGQDQGPSPQTNVRLDKSLPLSHSR